MREYLYKKLSPLPPTAPSNENLNEFFGCQSETPDISVLWLTIDHSKVSGVYLDGCFCVCYLGKPHSGYLMHFKLHGLINLRRHILIHSLIDRDVSAFSCALSDRSCDSDLPFVLALCDDNVFASTFLSSIFLSKTRRISKNWSWRPSVSDACLLKNVTVLVSRPTIHVTVPAILLFYGLWGPL